MMIKRHLSPLVAEALRDTPVVLLVGARQTGKSTLVRSLLGSRPTRRYLTLDDQGILDAAKSDPAGFLAGLDGPVTLDEIQKAPELFPAMKADVDRDRAPGRYLLTGSANVLMLPRLSESLAGRMEVQTLWPLSQGEMKGQRETFLDRVFQGKFSPPSSQAGGTTAWLEQACLGGFPEIAIRPSSSRRRAWFRSYITTVLSRDARDLSNIESLASLPRLLSLLASRTASLLNYADLSRSLGMPQSTLKRYMGLLQALFLYHPLPAYSNNLGQRLIKSPKVLLSDTGLLAFLSGINPDRLRQDPALGGHMLENYVAMELVKQASWSENPAQVFHFRTLAGTEVDIVLEDEAGRLVGLEVKASATPASADFRGLKALAESAGEKFVRGIVLYTGREVIPFAKNLMAVPLPSIWER
ncbi:MAG: ATP-binding protein [Acidobacteriota bacterium]